MVCRKPYVLTGKSVTELMEHKMSQITRQEVLAKKRDRHALAGKEHKTKIINELVELFAITARRPSARCNYGP